MLQEGLSHWLPDPDAVPALRAVTVADLLDEAVERSPDVEALVYYAYDDPELTLGGADDALGPRRGDTRSGRSLGSLRTVISGGSVVPPSLGNGWQQRLGVSFVITYGQTEHGPLAAVTTPRDSPERQITAVGRPIPHAALEVVEPGTDTRVPIGVEGELRFRGYVMRPSGDRGGRQPGRLAAVGRPRADRRGRLRTDHRQGQGHDHPRR